MTASVFRLFGSWQFGKRVEKVPDRPCAALRDEYAEALCAGWVPPVSENKVEMRVAAQASSPEFDAEAFLSRVYRFQQC